MWFGNLEVIVVLLKGRVGREFAAVGVGVHLVDVDDTCRLAPCSPETGVRVVVTATGERVSGTPER